VTEYQVTIREYITSEWKNITKKQKKTGEETALKNRVQKQGM